MTDIQICVKFLGHSATTTEGEIKKTIAELLDINLVRQASEIPTTDLRVQYDVSAWHGYILYPQFGSKNLNNYFQNEVIGQ